MNQPAVTPGGRLHRLMAQLAARPWAVVVAALLIAVCCLTILIGPGEQGLRLRVDLSLIHI